MDVAKVEQVEQVEAELSLFVNRRDAQRRQAEGRLKRSISLRRAGLPAAQVCLMTTPAASGTSRPCESTTNVSARYRQNRGSSRGGGALWGGGSVANG